MFRNFSRVCTALLGLLLACGLSACMPRQLLVNSAADAWTAQGQAEEEDMGLAREASAFYIKVSESLLRQTPGHLPLAETVASGLTQYAYAFVAFEAERLAATDSQAAHRLNERARRLYLRAHRHAMAALVQSQPGFVEALSRPQANQWPQVSPAQVGVAYWAAASWGATLRCPKTTRMPLPTCLWPSVWPPWPTPRRPNMARAHWPASWAISKPPAQAVLRAKRPFILTKRLPWVRARRPALSWTKPRPLPRPRATGRPLRLCCAKPWRSAPRAQTWATK